MAIGVLGGSSAVWTGDLTQSPDYWAPASIPPGTISAATAVACGQPAGGKIADCVIAVAHQAGAGQQLLDGSLTGSTWNWNPVGPSDIQYYTGVACESPPSASQSTCAAVGATANGPIVATSVNGPSGAWSDETPSSLVGTTATGIPIETSSGSSGTWTNSVPAGQSTNATSLGDIYPQPLGYSIAAADCPTEATGAPLALLSGLAGGSASVTIPLGFLPIQVVSATGTPVSGATVTLTSATAGCPTDTYSLPATDPNGMSLTSVPYGAYGYTITSGANSLTGTLQVGTNTVVAGTTTYLPDPVVVALMTVADSARGLRRSVRNRGRIRPVIGMERHHDDEGMTLTELLVASTVLVVLLTAVMLTMNVMDSVTASVGAEYQEFDQALPARRPSSSSCAPRSSRPRLRTPILRHHHSRQPRPRRRSRRSATTPSPFTPTSGCSVATLPLSSRAHPPVRQPPPPHPSQPARPRSWPGYTSQTGRRSRPATNVRQPARAAFRFGSSCRS